MFELWFDIHILIRHIVRDLSLQIGWWDTTFFMYKKHTRYTFIIVQGTNCTNTIIHACILMKTQTYRINMDFCPQNTSYH